MTMRTHTVQTEGAEIVYDVWGSGPPLLLIPGGGGMDVVYYPSAELLAARHTVISYDRRCNGRSTGDRAPMLDMAQQARDAVAVINAAGFSEAAVFGNSGGAHVALQLTADHPKAVTRLILHEAPTTSLLTNETLIHHYVSLVHAAYRIAGPHAAMALFAMGGRGIPPNALPRHLMDGMRGMHFFFGHEYIPITRYCPDLGAVRAANVPMVMLVGERSGEAYYVRTSRAVAEGLGCPCITIPGHHIVFHSDPEDFARAMAAQLGA